MNNTAKIFLGLALLGGIGALAMSMGEKMEDKKIHHQGTMQAGEALAEYDFIVVDSEEGADKPFSGHVRPTGEGAWGPDNKVAAGDDIEATQVATMAYIAEIA